MKEALDTRVVATSDSSFTDESEVSPMVVEHTLGDFVLGCADSVKDEGIIAVAAIPVSLGLVVFDVEHKEHIPEFDDFVIGFSETPRGRHYYFLGKSTESHLVHCDRAYSDYSIKMGYYRERLFNKDGSRRPPPMLVRPCDLLARYRTAFVEMQKMAEVFKWNFPRKSEPKLE